MIEGSLGFRDLGGYVVRNDIFIQNSGHEVQNRSGKKSISIFFFFSNLNQSLFSTVRVIFGGCASFRRYPSVNGLRAANIEFTQAVREPPLTLVDVFRRRHENCLQTVSL